MLIGEKQKLYTKYFIRHPERHGSNILKQHEKNVLRYFEDVYERLQTRHFLWLYSSQHVNRILQKLFDLGYVDRLDACRYWDGDLVYGITRKGDRVVAEMKNRRASNADFGRRNRTFPPNQLKHDQMTASLRVSLVVAARKHSYLNVLYDKQLLHHMPDQARNRKDPFRLHATLHTKNGLAEVTTKDDKSYIIQDRRAGSQFSDQVWLPEIDGFTETVESEAYSITRSFNPSIFEHKVAFGLAYARQKRQVEQFGTRALRYLVPVADSPETGVEGALQRIEHMVSTVMKMTDGQGSQRFVFTTEQNLRPDRVLDTYAWIDGTGKPTRLIDCDEEESKIPLSTQFLAHATLG